MRTSGYNVWWHKFIVFVIAGAFAGVSGVLYTYSTQFISPTVLGVETSFEAMLMVIIGGAGTLTGPLIGAAVVTGLRNYLSVFFESWLIILGLGTSSPSSSLLEESWGCSSKMAGSVRCRAGARRRMDDDRS